MIKRTALYDIHVGLSAKLVPFSGYEMPLSYFGVPEEHRAVRTAVGLFDISHMGRFDIDGKGAEGFLDLITTGPVRKIARGGAQYGLILKSDAGILDDIYLYRRGPQAYTMIVNAGTREKDLAWMKSKLSASAVALVDRTEETGLLALQGPKAGEVLARVLPAGKQEIQLRHFIETEVPVTGGCKALIARTGYTGERGYELLVPTPYLVPLWNALMEAGKADAIRPVGLGARDTLRLEMGYMLYGHDISEETTPVEADLMQFVALDKEFVGKDALVRRLQEGPKRRFAGFELLSGGIPREGHPIYSNGKQIGQVTSGNYSPTLRKGIGMGYMDTLYAQEGSEVFIDIRGKVTPALIVKRPFYKKKKGVGPH